MISSGEKPGTFGNPKSGRSSSALMGVSGIPSPSVSMQGTNEVGGTAAASGKPSPSVSMQVSSASSSSVKGGTPATPGKVWR